MKFLIGIAPLINVLLVCVATIAKWSGLKLPKLVAVLHLVPMDLHLSADMMLLEMLDPVTLWNPSAQRDVRNNLVFLLSRKLEK
jgi:hypothetical protein